MSHAVIKIGSPYLSESTITTEITSVCLIDSHFSISGDICYGVWFQNRMKDIALKNSHYADQNQLTRDILWNAFAAL